MTERRRSILLLIFGAIFLLCAAALYSLQLQRDRLAGEAAAALVSALKSGRCTVQTEPAQPTAAEPAQEEPEKPASPTPQEPIALTPDGYEMLGILKIEALSIELPVLAKWSYELLDISPCRYSGTVAGGNLVILGHSYDSHFRPLRQAEAGMEVELTDAAGFLHRYRVAEVETVAGSDGDALPSAYPLTLFTCTSDSRHRVLVRCEAIGP